MPMYNLIKCQYYRDEPALNKAGDVIDFSVNNNCGLSKFKEKHNSKIGQTDNNGTKDVKLMVPLKYLNNFWRNLEMSLINCEINLILTCSANCFISTGTIANIVPTFTIADAKL